MSDYVQNPEYSMQLAVAEDDPASYDWARLQEEVDQAIPGPFADITLASLQEDTGVEDLDWSSQDEALKNGSWRDLWLEGLDDQGARARPDDRAHFALDSSRVSMASDLEAEPEHIPAFYCDFSGCKRGSFPYKHKGDLNRHKKKSHKCERHFRCAALECNYSFTREDKLRDHIRAGHDDETLFACLEQDCQALLTRDLLIVHKGTRLSRGSDTMSTVRQCPLPKCSFRVRFGRFARVFPALDALQQHLLDCHDVKGRKRLAPLLEERGYHYESANVVCSVCPEFSDFETHEDFRVHFLLNHCLHPNMPTEGQLRAGERFWWGLCETAGIDKLREHRRTVLSLFPDFRSHPVWEDIERCPQ